LPPSSLDKTIKAFFYRSLQATKRVRGNLTGEDEIASLRSQ
jgi:hypothetical protein